jgi:hypothetical protein
MSRELPQYDVPVKKIIIHSLFRGKELMFKEEVAGLL